MSEINTYVVYAVHPDTGAVLSVQLIGTDKEAAWRRTRGSLMHGQHDLRWLDGIFEIVACYPGARMEESLPEMDDDAVAAWVAAQNAEEDE